eukprot:CAMPEP_0169475014 /NCGR_PEP_ID=MMETSP1042-20121227/26580_1 /TAXON_ID=464988 /ORGANISM="Hemiselmis andersenii, Strain CCMP1180" /LENGTH=63 /DNA_ID=CAMNT_0009589115 /DNA_START=60 /DNA_END=248 /DNA_ORIENTATION=+
MGGWLYEGIRPSISQEEAIMGQGSVSTSPRTQLDAEATLRLHQELMEAARDKGQLPSFCSVAQ